MALEALLNALFVMSSCKKLVIVTVKEIMELFDQLHQDGQTIILVTHEADVAQHAGREIVLRDGVIATDTRNLQ